MAACLSKLIDDDTLTDDEKAKAKTIVENVPADSDVDADDDGDNRGKGKGSAGPKSEGHGGYMPKLAQIMAAIYRNDEQYSNKLADRFYSGSAMLRKLVNSKPSEHGSWEKWQDGRGPSSS